LTDTTRVGPAEILDALRLRWRLAALVLVAVFAGVFAYDYSLPSQYTAKVIVSLTPRPSVRKRNAHRPAEISRAT